MSVEPGLDELDRGEPAVRAVWPVDVVVDAPVLEEDLSFEQGRIAGRSETRRAGGR